jgi:hypothetical protein
MVVLRAIHVEQQLDDLMACLAVQVSGWLVSREERWFVGQSTGDGDALLFAAGNGTDSDACGRQVRLRRGASARRGASRPPAISIGTSTFSNAVSEEK